MTAAQMLKAAGFPNTPQGRKSFYSQYPDEQAFMKKHSNKMAMGGLTNQVGFPQQPTANKFYSEGFRPNVPFGFYQDGGNQQEAQMQQLMAKIAQQLQQGAQPQQILQELVKMGVPQDQAAKILQTTIQYLQQHPSPQQAQGQPQEAPEQEAQEPMQQQGPEEEQMEGPQMAYGGYTDEVAFPQQPTANHFYNSGWKPNTPFGFYEEGGLTDEIAFPQQPVDAWIHAHTPYVPSYNVGGGLPDGANNMPCMNCGGYMQDGGSSDGSANQYGGFVGMDSPSIMQYGGPQKKLNKKKAGGKVDGEDLNQYVSNRSNAFVNSIRDTVTPFITKAADEKLNNTSANVNPAYAQYGISTGYSNQYSGTNDGTMQQYNLQNLANQNALQNDIDAYDTQSANASSNMFDATSNLASELFMAKGGALNKYQFAGGIGSGSAMGTNAKQSAVNPSTGMPINTSQGNKSASSNDDMFRQYFNEYLDQKFGMNNTDANNQYTYNYNTPSYGANDYFKFKVKGDKDLRNNYGNLMSKFNLADTELKNIEYKDRSKLAKFFGMKDPRKVTLNFRSRFTPQAFSNFNFHPTSSPGVPTPPVNDPGIMNVSGPNMRLSPGTQVRASDIIANNANINVSPNSQIKTYGYGGLQKAQAGINMNSPIYKPFNFTDISGAPSTFNANQFAPNKLSLGSNNNIQSFAKEKQQEALKTQGLNRLKSDTYKDFSVDVKKKKDFNTGLIGDLGIAGMDYLTGIFNEDEKRAAKEKLQKSTMADNLFASVPANAVGSGDYGFLAGQQEGMFRPNEYTPVYKPGVITGRYGGMFQDGGIQDDYYDGEETELTQPEIDYILANGGQIEYLD